MHAQSAAEEDLGGLLLIWGTRSFNKVSQWTKTIMLHTHRQTIHRQWTHSELVYHREGSKQAVCEFSSFVLLLWIANMDAALMKYCSEASTCTLLAAFRSSPQNKSQTFLSFPTAKKKNLTHDQIIQHLKLASLAPRNPFHYGMNVPKQLPSFLGNLMSWAARNVFRLLQGQRPELTAKNKFQRFIQKIRAL